MGTDRCQSDHVTILLPRSQELPDVLFPTVEHRTRDISQPRRFHVLLYYALRTSSNCRRRRRIATDMLQSCGWTTCMCYDLYAKRFTLLTREREICHCDWS